jgi:heme iron utilization protein
MSIEPKTAALAALKARFAGDQSGVLEDIARENGLTTREVMDCLPPPCHAVAGGAAFEAIMAEVAGWGEVTLLVHTADVILEYKGVLPPGRMARGTFNLLDAAFSGHIRLGNCVSIHFLRRCFMTLDTAAIVFVNRQGEAMFKIFAGRNPDRSLNGSQVEKFGTLRDRFAAAPAESEP